MIICESFKHSSNRRINDDQSMYRVTQVVTMEGELQQDVLTATDALVKLLPVEFVVKVVADDDLMDV